MNTLKRWSIALIAGLIGSSVLLGCNTFRGAGKDIQKGGQKIENAAEGAQNK